ncbi:putative transporter small subunit [Halomonas piscis]|uniref:Transporter small subunit n=1 Tax=Halomonas piscis TaxID=3031727 RepID=A0ABY9Z035_9GAMM|nr:putative transporter small subunit [Halomonas piscis]WNK20491.1 putative transporter small subunit [Halomonas piscis]
MTALMGFYVLIWPALTLGVLILICRAVIRDRRQAQKERRDMV